MPPIPLDPALASAAAPVSTPPAALNAGLSALSTPPVLPGDSGVSANLPTAITSAPNAAPVAPKLSFGEKIAREATKLSAVNSGPGSWARSLVGAAVNALSGDVGDAAAVGTVPAGGGVLTGVERTLAARSQRIQAAQQAAAQQAQQNKENEFKQQELGMEGQRLDIDQQNAEVQRSLAQKQMVTAEKAARNYDMEYQEKLLASDQDNMSTYVKEGSTPIAQHLTAAQLQEKIQQNPTITKSHLAFRDGFTETPGPDGTTQSVPTYTLLADVPNVTLSKENADTLNKYNPNPNGEEYKPGEIISGSGFYLLSKTAQANQSVALNVDKTRAAISASLTTAEARRLEAINSGLDIRQKKQNIATANDFAPVLAQSNGDPILATQTISDSIAQDKAVMADPKATLQQRQQALADYKQKNGLAGRVQQLYGPGVLTKARQEAITDLDKTIEDDTKTLNNIMNPPDDDQKIQLQGEIEAAKSKRNLYLGIHANAPAAITQSIKALDAVAPNQRAANIINSNAPAGTKLYLLKHYNLPVPANLQTPAPAAQ